MLRRLRLQLVIFSMLFGAPAFASTGYIDTPDECYVVAKLQGSDVYLKSVGSCNGKPGRVYVEASGSVKVYVEGKFWKEEETTSLSIPDINDTLNRTRQLSERIVVPENLYREGMEKKAKNLNEMYRSPEYQQKVAEETERIKKVMFQKPLEDYYADAKKDDPPKKGAGNLPEDERVYLFISSSMPVATIRNYIASVARYHDKNMILVLRGFVGGMTKIGPTMKFIADSLKVDPLCAGADCEMYVENIVVDPLLYRRYEITHVPAVVYAKGVNRSNPDESEGQPGTSVASSTTVYGDASLEYILDLIRRETGSKSLASLTGKQ